MYYAGIDIGSTMTKVVLVDAGLRVVGSVLGPSGAEHRRLANRVMRQALAQAGLRIEDMTYIVATGYGRVNVPFADAQVSEITCHAHGISCCYSDVRTIIDIGGQDTKGVRVENGRVTDFVMNDKCAAGTGRFLEIVAEILGVGLEEMADLCFRAKNRIGISNICTVFAAQEITSSLARGLPREDIAAGLHDALAVRICNMVKRLGVVPGVVITGGGAKNKALVCGIEDQLGLRVLTPDEPLITGALGAAFIAGERAQKALAEGSLGSRRRTLEEVRLFD